MDDLVKSLTTCTMDKTTTYHRIMTRMIQLDPYIDRRILTPVITTNLNHILTQHDLLRISNLCIASMFYKKLFPGRSFAPIVLRYVRRKKLPAFFFVFYCFFDCMSPSERRHYFYDIELLADILFEKE